MLSSKITKCKVKLTRCKAILTNFRVNLLDKLFFNIYNYIGENERCCREDYVIKFNDSS